VMMYVRYPLSLRQVEDLLFERGVDIGHETVRFWWSRFGPMFAAAIRKRGFKTDHTRTGVGSWTRYSSGSMARRTISGGLLITRARCSPPSAGIGGPRLSF
jgi:hypothetical protein